ncbi:hypothetical protein ACFL5X_00550 [Candidatus Omnitrophota bacterium]
MKQLLLILLCFGFFVFNSWPQAMEGQMPPPPQEAIAICEGASISAACVFQSPHGKVSGRCQKVGEQVACVP